MSIKFFIFCWPGWEDQAISSAEALRARGCDVQVLASGVAKDADYWVELDEDAHFGDQFRAALKTFHGDVLVHLQADATIPDVSIFLSRLTSVFANNRIGVWAPDVDFTTWTTQVVGLSESFNTEFGLMRGLQPVINTDCTCWAIRSQVLDRLQLEEIEDFHYGWGLDLSVCATSYLLDLVVVRDHFMIVQHPQGTGYAQTEASEEWKAIQPQLSPDLRGVISLLALMGRKEAERANHWSRRLKRKLKRRLRTFSLAVK